ncbi:hypothetical protein EV182_005205, partial [Spiromyces aspiralis]
MLPPALGWSISRPGLATALRSRLLLSPPLRIRNPPHVPTVANAGTARLVVAPCVNPLIASPLARAYCSGGDRKRARHGTASADGRVPGSDTTPYVLALLAGTAALGVELWRLKRRPVEARDDTGSGADVRELCLLALHNDIQGLKQLIKMYPATDVNARHPLGWTPLLVAAANGSHEMVKLLLELGAQPNIVDEFQVPRHSRNYQEIRNTLIQREREFCSMIYPTAPTQGFT